MIKKVIWVNGFLLFIFFFSIISLLFYVVLVKKEFPEKSNKKVYIRKKGESFDLIKDGRPFIVKGGSGYTNLKELSEIGGNTIRTWDTTNLDGILNEALIYDISVIVGLNMLQSSYNDMIYSNQEEVNKLHQAFYNIVNKYKDHPSVLMWCLGNELEFNLGVGYEEFYHTYRDLIKMIKTSDPDHPITTTLWGRGRQDLACFKIYDLEIDIISINRFGNLHSIKEELENDSWLWEWPFIITEWGYNGPWEKNATSWNAPLEDNDYLKAERIDYVYHQYLPQEHSGFLGSMIFYWGIKQERTHTWFSFFDEEGNRTRSVEKVMCLFNEVDSGYSAPYINSITLENMEAGEDIILSPDKIIHAKASAIDPQKDTLSFKWEIYKEQWYYSTRVISDKPENLNYLLLKNEGDHIELKTPDQDGPYRLFVYVFDGKGNYGSANIPFYIIE